MDFLFILVFIFLLIAILQDLKRREIDNWLNLLLLFTGSAFIVFSFSQTRILNLVFLLVFSAIISNLLFYSRVFAYGDTKLLFAMTPLFAGGFFMAGVTNFLIYVGLLALATVVWGLGAISFLTLKNWKEVSKDFAKNFNLEMKLVLCLAIVLILLFFVNLLFSFLGLILLLFTFLFTLSKSIEQKVLTKEVSFDKVSEGEWLAEDIKIGKRTFKYSWEGLSEKDIAFLKKHKKKIKVKQGIPFAPGFLIAFALYYFKDFLWALIF